MAGPIVNVSISPTGGAIILNITLGNPSYDLYSTLITIQRYTGSLTSTPTTILNSSPYTPVYIDAGDHSPRYLDFTTQYWYTITDPSGTTTVGPIIPASQIGVFSSYLDGLLFRLFSAGISSVALPQGFNPIRVLETLPLTPASDGTYYPYVVMNLDLEQQEDVQIGEMVLASQTNLNILPLNIMRRYSINILSHNAKERDFYKDACKAVAYTMMVALNMIGQGFTYDIQATNTQVGDDLMMPGFYVAVVMLEFTGQMNMSITTTYGPINFINPNITETGTQQIFNITFTT